jgi:hypothetical protein
MSAGLDANNMPSGTAATAGLHKFAFTAVGAPRQGAVGTNSLSCSATAMSFSSATATAYQDKATLAC